MGAQPHLPANLVLAIPFSHSHYHKVLKNNQHHADKIHYAQGPTNIKIKV